MEMSLKMLEKMQVVTTDGRKIGTVKKSEIDTANWRVRSLTIAVRKEDTAHLGLQKPLLHTALIDVGTERVTNLSDYVTLNISEQELKELLDPSTSKMQTMTKR